MRFDLATLAKRSGARRSKTLPAIVPTQAQQHDLFVIYNSVPRLVATYTKERIIPAYERAVAQSVRDGISHNGTKTTIKDDIPELAEELSGLDRELQRLVLTLTPEMRKLLVRQEAHHRRRWIQNVLTATTVDLTTMIGPEDAREEIAASLARNVGLITDLSREARAKTADAVWRGFQARRAAREVAKDIQEAMETSRARAVRISSHQLQVLSASLDRERQTQAGIEAFKWRHGGSANPRPEHVERDGRIYRWAKPPSELPGQLPNCKCRAQAWLVVE